MRTFIDADVLIAAWRSSQASRHALIARLEGAGATFVASPFLALELLPKPRAYRRYDEVEFFEFYLSAAEMIPVSPRMVTLAMIEASRVGLAAMDALHLAAAHVGACERFVTLERREKPMYRTTLVTVVHVEELISA